MAEIPLVGEEFAGYRLLSVLGRGGMSIVFRAENPRLGNVIALKVLDPELANNDMFRSRFLEESRIAASMNHPNVIPIHDTGSSDGLLYIAMRYVSGTDLRQMLKQRGSLPNDESVFLLSQAARALDAAHRRGLVHRDVKPANLLIERGTDEGDPQHVYLTDFGITKHQDGATGLTSAGALLGTIDYIAPEQVRGMAVLGMADQYSLGCVLYECLTGRLPYEKDFGTAIMWAHVEEPPIPPTSVRPDLPPAIDDVISRVLAKRPGDRYDSCRAFMNDARAALGLADQMSPSGSLGMMAGPGAASYQGETAGAGYHPQTEMTHDRYESRGEPSGAGQYPPTQFTPNRYESRGEPSGAGQYPPTQFTPNRYESHAEPTASWSVSQAVPPPPAATSMDPVAPPSGPGHRGGRRRRSRGGGWLVAALALLLVAGAAAAVTLSLTGGHKSPQANGTPTAGGSTASGSAAASAAGVAANVALPTVAGTIKVGGFPSYIQVAPNGKFAYAANPGADAITVINTATDRVSRTINIPQGPPQSLSFSPDSRTAYVSVYKTNGTVHLVAFIDTATGNVTSTVQVDNLTPGPSVTSPDGRFLYVPNHNTTLTGAGHNVIDVIDTATRTVVHDVPVPADPHWIVFGKDGQRFYSTDHMSATVTVLNASTNTIITNISVGETPHSAILSPDGSRLAVTSFDGNVVFMIDTATNKMVAQIPVGKNPQDIAYSRDGKFLYTVNNLDNSVTVISTADNRVVGTVKTGKSPTTISLLPNGRQAYITDENDGTIEILNLPK